MVQRHRGTAVLLAIAVVTVAVSLVNQEGAHWLRATANLVTLAIVVVLVAQYMRHAPAIEG